jgi:small subunit ribosomal protein S20
MPIKKASFKSLRQSKKRRARNLRVKTPLLSSIKAAKKLAESKKIEEAKAAVLKTVKMLDRAAAKGIIKKNTAARKKSRLMKKLNALTKK